MTPEPSTILLLLLLLPIGLFLLLFITQWSSYDVKCGGSTWLLSPPWIVLVLCIIFIILLLMLSALFDPLYKIYRALYNDGVYRSLMAAATIRGRLCYDEHWAMGTQKRPWLSWMEGGSVEPRQRTIGMNLYLRQFNRFHQVIRPPCNWWLPKCLSLSIYLHTYIYVGRNNAEGSFDGRSIEAGNLGQLWVFFLFLWGEHLPKIICAKDW